MNKVNPFPTLTTPCPIAFLLNLSNTDDVALVPNLGKTSSSKGTARSSNVFVLNYSSYYLKFYQGIYLIQSS